VLGALLVGLFPAGPAAAAEPGGPGTLPSSLAAAAAKPYRIDLLEPEDFVSQTNDVQCIGASLQMMVNMTAIRSDRSAATQRRLFLLARELSWLPGDNRRPRPDWEPRGASSRGWARALGTLGVGNYVLRSQPTFEGAVTLAARTMRLTGLPVGLLVWRGRHAWVMTGFRATADPALTNDFTVTSVSVADPWYPRNSRTWGPSPKPGSRLSPGTLSQDFVALNSSWRSGHGGRWLLVLPQVAHPAPSGALPV
jgi:hypothetical protein